MTTTPTGPLLSISDLRVEFRTEHGTVRALEEVEYSVDRGEILGVVGESGSGKTVTALSVLRLLPPSARILQGRIDFDGIDLRRADRRTMRHLRGRRIGMIFQDPMTTLNPVMRVGDQIDEAVHIHHRSESRAGARRKTLATLELVGVTDAARRARQYPHEWSGGMRQRAVIAMALINQPDLIIADEPTTALDATVQAQVIDVLRRARAETGVAVILITHNLGLVAEIVDRVVVMYAGRVVEQAPVRPLLRSSAHPYTLGLIASRPGTVAAGEKLVPIPGLPPDMRVIPSGCAFRPRCSSAGDDPRCATERPPLIGIDPQHQTACHHADVFRPVDGVVAT